MKRFGTLQTIDNRYSLQFERLFPKQIETVFQSIVNPDSFTQWYPFATGEMELKESGIIKFDDEEGSLYEGVITRFEPPYTFAFKEVDDFIDIELKTNGDLTHMTFTHTFDDHSWAVMTAAGWHRCLDVLEMIINGENVEWPDNAANLRELYEKQFNGKLSNET